MRHRSGDAKASSPPPILVEKITIFPRLVTQLLEGHPNIPGPSERVASSCGALAGLHAL
jgi:hypothetical protein